MGAKTKSSRRWLDRHFKDAYVKRARQVGYRSRAAYKLLEIQEKDRILGPGMSVVDLWAAPGGWSQAAARIVRPQGRIVALDSLPMEPLSDVIFVQADFREAAALDQLRQSLKGRSVDVMLSDMAPNLSGNPAVNQPRMMYLCELVLDLARQLQRPGGALVVKTFQVEGFEAFHKAVRASFKRISGRKPQSSRPRSRELYISSNGVYFIVSCSEWICSLVETAGAPIFRVDAQKRYRGRFSLKQEDSCLERHGEECGSMGGHCDRPNIGIQ